MRVTGPLPEVPGSHEVLSTGPPSLQHWGTDQDMSEPGFGYPHLVSVKPIDSQSSLRSKPLPQPLRARPTFTTRHPQDEAHEQFGSGRAVIKTPHNTEPPRKYRLKNKPSSLDSCIWQDQDDTPLTEILEQERSAWSTRSPTGTTSDDSAITPAGLQSGHLSSFAECPNFDQEDKHPWKRQRLTSSRGLSDHDPDQPNLNYHEIPAGSRNTIDRSPDHQRAVRIPAKRKSSFLEGSMNENSKGVASTWTPPSATGNVGSDYSSFLSDSDDGERTPRASAASRASTSSSIDINEFKPLPATPSTFKNTVKRLGQKLRNPEIVHGKRNEPCLVADDKQKRRLRKSVSTWKLFGNLKPASEAEDREDPVAKQPRGGRTLRAFRSAKAEAAQADADADAAYKAILDERKRKAEAIYAEQYSTVRKRQKHVDALQGSVAVQSRSTDTATVPKQKSSGLRTISTMKTALHRASSKQDIISGENNSTSASHFSIIPEPLPVAPNLAQSHSRANLPVSTANADYLKKPTITELEKENQHLRSMLREKNVRTVAGRSGHHNRRKSASDEHLGQKEELETRPKSSSGVEGVDDKLSRFTELVRGLDSMQKSFVNQSHPDDPPPMPRVPSHLEHTTAFSSNDNRVLMDTSTMKRRAPLREHSSQANLPRPLSMVLEGIETNDSEAKADSPKSTKASAGKKRQHAHYDGSTDGENVPHAKVEGPTKWNEHYGSKAQQWQWPEDVF